jgi:hypothetical protein
MRFRSALTGPHQPSRMTWHVQQHGTISSRLISSHPIPSHPTGWQVREHGIFGLGGRSRVPGWLSLLKRRISSGRERPQSAFVLELTPDQVA